MKASSILYQNSDSTVFLIDIPTSIALGQEMSNKELPPDSRDPESETFPFYPRPKSTRRHLFSSVPLRTPYPVSEPKTDAARAKVLERIPPSETAFHSKIKPLVDKALKEIKTRHGAEWSLPRKLWNDPGLGDALGENHIEPVSGLLDSPPLILSPGINRFGSILELQNIRVRNTSTETATIKVRFNHERRSYTNVVQECSTEESELYHTFFIPPASNFLLCNLPISQPIVDKEQGPQRRVIPGLPHNKEFSLILLDPPWSNRSVRRSGYYRTQSYLESETLTDKIRDILKVHSINSPHFPSNPSIAAIWVTNSAKARKSAYDAMQAAKFTVCEEWIWVKTTIDGQPITPLDGLWRKPYEALVLGKKMSSTTGGYDSVGSISRRVIAAVPDIHSRKPNLRELFEQLFFSELLTSANQPKDAGYSALEVFARNLTAGWWACGNEVLKFNSEEWWAH